MTSKSSPPQGLSTAMNIHLCTKTRNPKVEVLDLVVYHYNRVGGHTGKFRHITTLQADVRLQDYPHPNLSLHISDGIYSFRTGIIW